MARQPRPRRPRDMVQVNLRIREFERRQLEAAAKRNMTSLNAEMAARIMRSFEQEHALMIDQLAENVSRALMPLLGDAHELAKFGDLTRAVDGLLGLVQPLLATKVIAGPTADAIRTAIGKISSVRRMIEIEAGQRLAQMRTTGAE